MGRKSRAKRERRERGARPVAGALSGHSRSSLLALLEAASVSPNASQYLPSLAVVYRSLVADARLGDRPVSASLLEPLIRAAHMECSSAAEQEDFLPHDPRLDVRVEWVGEIFRFVAGDLERPTSDIETLRRLALLIDPVLREHGSHGVTDLVELVLRRVDAVVQSLAPVWALDLVPELESASGVSQVELAAAANVPSLDYQIAQCHHPGRARAALDAHSVSIERLRRSSSSRMGTLGTSIAVRHGAAEFTPLPAGLMVGNLNALASSLVAKSLMLDPSLDGKWQKAVSGFVGHVFAGAGNGVFGPLKDEQCPHLHSVIRYSDAQYLVISVAAGMDHRRLQETIGAAVRCLEEVRPGSSLRTGDGVVSIPNSAKLCRLLIVAQPQTAISPTLAGTSCAAITLQDLDWIRRTIGRDEIDLWYFVRDQIEQPRIGQLLSWDGIDLWEVWRNSGKSFYRGARRVDVLYVQPHHSAHEWRKASEQREIEMALHLLGLGRISMWPMHDLDGTSMAIGNTLTDDLYRLIVCATPVAVSLRPLSGTEPFPELAAKIGECIAYKLECTESEFSSLMAANGLRSLRVEFVFESSTHTPPLRIVSFENEVLTLGCTPHLVERFKTDSRAVETQLGRLLAEAIGGEAGEFGEFVNAWRDAPPGIRFDLMTVDPKQQRTPDAAPLHEAHRSARLAELGAHLDESDIEPDTYRGSEAKRLETRVIYPWLIARLRDQLSAFDCTALLGYALTQLEYANCHRWWQVERSRFEVGSPTDDAEYQAETSQDLLRQSRAIGLMIEEILALAPTGTGPPSEYEWQELLSLATIAGESGFRSEALHLELADTALVLSSSYEVTITDSELNASIDFEAYARDRRLSALPDPVPIGADNDTNTRDDEWAPIGERAPGYAKIDAALQSSLGFGLDAIMGIFDTVIQWPVSPPSCTEHLPMEQLAAEAHEANPAIPLSCYTAAVEWLSLGQADFVSAEALIEHWEIEPRAARIAIRPLACEGTRVWVTPWSAEIAKRTWRNYLSEHRLPIPDSDLPEPVVEALAGARQQRQRDFEKECRSQLDGLPLKSIGRVRHTSASAHGIKHLSGEIDDLCIDAERSLVFVIEAKDPFVALSARSVNRQIAQFHRPDGYVPTLEQKVQEIRASAASLAANKHIEQPDREWQVVGVMVTRHVTPAAYMRECPTTFCTIDTLRRTIEGFES